MSVFPVKSVLQCGVKKYVSHPRVTFCVSPFMPGQFRPIKPVVGGEITALPVAVFVMVVVRVAVTVVVITLAAEAVPLLQMHEGRVSRSLVWHCSSTKDKTYSSAFFTASDAPTPPPTAAAMMTMTSSRITSAVVRFTLHLCRFSVLL